MKLKPARPNRLATRPARRVAPSTYRGVARTPTVLGPLQKLAGVLGLGR